MTMKQTMKKVKGKVANTTGLKRVWLFAKPKTKSFRNTLAGRGCKNMWMGKVEDHQIHKNQVFLFACSRYGWIVLRDYIHHLLQINLEVLLCSLAARDCRPSCIWVQCESPCQCLASQAREAKPDIGRYHIYYSTSSEFGSTSSQCRKAEVLRRKHLIKKVTPDSKQIIKTDQAIC